jgi:hypothetical protein
MSSSDAEYADEEPPGRNSAAILPLDGVVSVKLD